MNCWQRGRGSLVLIGLFVIGLCLVSYGVPQTRAAAGYSRIVVLSDAHLPVRTEVVQDVSKQLLLESAKKKVLQDINGWDDVTQVAVLGDITAERGTVEEYAYAVRYFDALKKTLWPIVGNHDYMYADALSEKGKRVRADARERQTKLERFKEAFHLPEVYYSKQEAGYLLLFLSPDSLDGKYLTEISSRQLAWVQQQLDANPQLPTIVFFHAPLAGTLAPYNKEANTPNFIAQPEAALAELIQRHPQLFLWVSGHTHTPATNASFASPINVYAGQVTNIHNADMDRESIWTNSLYLYPDRVVVKTFDHKKGAWMPQLERTIYPGQVSER
nr:metallophosphoesterase [uncultured Anaeromusa sp.]